MLSELVKAAESLERRMSTSRMHKMHANYMIGTGNGDPTVANFLFRTAKHMEKARQIEAAFAAGLITLEKLYAEFPNVYFVAVNAHYSVSDLLFADTFVSNGVSIGNPDINGFLSEMSIELCKGARVTYVPDDKKLRSDVVVGVTAARSGTVSDVYKTDYKPPFSFKIGTSITDVFDRMERYVMTNGRFF